MWSLFFVLTFERIFAIIKLSKRQRSGWMYHIEFYTAADGTSKLWDLAQTNHLEDDIWELRPGNNRVLYFYHKDDTYVLLHQFRKKTQKTPRREIEKAKAERDDWISRKG
jgi:phage-related protein